MCVHTLPSEGTGPCTGASSASAALWLKVGPSQGASPLSEQHMVTRPRTRSRPQQCMEHAVPSLEGEERRPRALHYLQHCDVPSEALGRLVEFPPFQALLRCQVVQLFVEAHPFKRGTPRNPGTNFRKMAFCCKSDISKISPIHVLYAIYTPELSSPHFIHPINSPQLSTGKPAGISMGDVTSGGQEPAMRTDQQLPPHLSRGVTGKGGCRKVMQGRVAQGRVHEASFCYDPALWLQLLP